METKSWWQSRMFWVNATTLLAGVVGYIAGHDVIKDNVSAVSLLVAVQGAVNVALRFLTIKPIG